MKTSRVLIVTLIMCVLVVSIGTTFGHEDRTERSKRIMREWNEEAFAEFMEPDLSRWYTSAQVDTYNIVKFDFDGQDWQGWTRFDFTRQRGEFFHVDDFAGLGGGDFGGLVPIEGTKSMWCGARPGTDEYMCSWFNAPGYGNRWNQILRAGPFFFPSGTFTISYHLRCDSEPEYDFTSLEYVSLNANGCTYKIIAFHDGTRDAVAFHEVFTTQLDTKIQFHFVSDGAGSDQDGLWNTDGAVIVDSITLAHPNGIIDFEDFEGAAVGDKHVGIWDSSHEVSYGSYSSLAHNLTDKDPCGDNLSTQVIFFIGYPGYPSESYPGLFDTPFCKTPFYVGPSGIKALCQYEGVISPIIDMTKYSTNNDEIQDADIPPSDLPELGDALLRYTVYDDNPIQNLVFYNWAVRNIDPTGCPGLWMGPGFWYYTDGGGDYIFNSNSIGHLVTSDSIQVLLSVRDMCDVWYPTVGNCEEHTPAPWFDNVRIQRYKTIGPQWSYRDLDLFQDNFPEEKFNMESWVRADAANDIKPYDDLPIILPYDNLPIILPGDSIVVDCTSPLGGGIAEDAGGPKIYLHVRCTDLRPTPRPNLYGPSLEGSDGHYVSDDGTEWTILQCDSVYSYAGDAVEDRYAVDLNDSLFTRGYMIEYYFKAYDNAGESSTLPTRAESHGVFFEWTCLPTGKSDILYVDDFAHRGGGEGYGLVKRYFDPTFETVLMGSQPDVYQVNSPSSLVSNGPGSRARNNHLVTFYNTIIWDSGDLDVGTITDGTPNSDKSNDLTLLINWMNTAEHDVGIWVLGDNIAYDLHQNLTNPRALEFMNTWCGVDYVEASYYHLTGEGRLYGVTNPLVTGVPGGIFYHSGSPDSFCVYGGCPTINKFDILAPWGNGIPALKYPDFGGETHYAGIQFERTNVGGHTVRTMWFGFSFMYIRDTGPYSPMMRNVIFDGVRQWMGMGAGKPDITGGEVPTAYRLAQNFPNPFNPTTTIKFDMKAKGNVTIKLYNVAGQLVKTLVNDVKDAGSYTATWDGTNNNGSKVASGIYFYRMETKGFCKTKKMVLLR